MTEKTASKTNVRFLVQSNTNKERTAKINSAAPVLAEPVGIIEGSAELTSWL